MGHWQAAIQEQVGERYIRGHQNLRLGDFLRLLEAVSEQSAPCLKIPYAMAYAAEVVGEVWGRVTGREPAAMLDAIR